QAHRSSVAVRKDGFRIFLDKRLQLRRDRLQRFIPGNALESSIAFPADPPHWVEQTICVVGSVLITRDLHAETAMREWMGRIAFHSNRPALLINFYEHGASVGTIVWHNTAYNLHRARFPVV